MVIDLNEIIRQFARLHSCDGNGTGQYLICMPQKPRKGDLRELNSKTFKGKHALGPPRTLRLWRWFRKSVSIYPRSAPVGYSIVEVSVLLCNDWGYSTLSFTRILVKMRRWGRPLSEIWHPSTSIWVSRSIISVHYLDKEWSPIRRPQPDLNFDMFVPNLFFLVRYFNELIWNQIFIRFRIFIKRFFSLLQSSPSPSFIFAFYTAFGNN